MVETGFTDDIATALALAEPYLMADPVAHNVALTLLADLERTGTDAGAQTGRPLRFWWGRTGGVLTGLCFTVGPRQCLVDAADRATAVALAATVAETTQHLPGVTGELAAASAFVAEWAAARHLAVETGVFQRYLVLDTLIPPPSPEPSGHLRPPRPDELDLLVEWQIGFQHDAFGPGDVDVDDLTTTIRDHMERSLLWLWVTDQPVSMAAASPIIGGVSRIRGVYTPPERRGAGYAAACVAGVVTDRMAAGATHCSLYADLANPTSNGVYRRLGFRPHHEHVNYVFD